MAVGADLFARFLGPELELAAGKLRSVTSNTTARPKPPFSRGPIETAHFTVAFDASSCAIWRYGRAHRQSRRCSRRRSRNRMRRPLAGCVKSTFVEKSTFSCQTPKRYLVFRKVTPPSNGPKSRSGLNVSAGTAGDRTAWRRGLPETGITY